jgi:hypothetical protein
MRTRLETRYRFRRVTSMITCLLIGMGSVVLPLGGVASASPVRQSPWVGTYFLFLTEGTPPGPYLTTV